MNRILIALAAALLWSAAMFGAGWAWRGDRAERDETKGLAEQTRQAVKASESARQVEQQSAIDIAAIGDKHEQDRQAAEAVPDAVVADLRAGNLKLRDDLASCTTARLSQAVAGSVERDAGAQLREEVAGRIVQVGRDADDQLRACQAVVRADRGML